MVHYYLTKLSFKLIIIRNYSVRYNLSKFRFLNDSDDKWTERFFLKGIENSRKSVTTFHLTYHENSKTGWNSTRKHSSNCIQTNCGLSVFNLAFFALKFVQHKQSKNFVLSLCVAYLVFINLKSKDDKWKTVWLLTLKENKKSFFISLSCLLGLASQQSAQKHK